MLGAGAGFRCWVLVLVLELVGTGAGAEVVQRCNGAICICTDVKR